MYIAAITSEHAQQRYVVHMVNLINQHALSF